LRTIGHGLLAQRFDSVATDSHYTIFASGVSNSAENDKAAFDRERTLLLKSSEASPLVYFGSCSIEMPSSKWTPYINHKHEMEELMVDAKLGVVLRLPNVVGIGGNPNTMFNFFRYAIQEGKKIVLRANAKRSLIDIDDVASLTEDVLKNFVVNNPPSDRVFRFVVPQQYQVLDIIKEIEGILDIEALVEIAGEDFLDIKSSSYVSDAISRGIIEFKDDYLSHLVKKYLI